MQKVHMTKTNGIEQKKDICYTSALVSPFSYDIVSLMETRLIKMEQSLKPPKMSLAINK